MILLVGLSCLRDSSSLKLWTLLAWLDLLLPLADVFTELFLDPDAKVFNMRRMNDFSWLNNLVSLHYANDMLFLCLGVKSPLFFILD